MEEAGRTANFTPPYLKKYGHLFDEKLSAIKDLIYHFFLQVKCFLLTNLNLAVNSQICKKSSVTATDWGLHY
jgi:hypothetical protein